MSKELKNAHEIYCLLPTSDFATHWQPMGGRKPFVIFSFINLVPLVVSFEPIFSPAINANFKSKQYSFTSQLQNLSRSIQEPRLLFPPISLFASFLINFVGGAKPRSHFPLPNESSQRRSAASSATSSREPQLGPGNRSHRISAVWR